MQDFLLPQLEAAVDLWDRLDWPRPEIALVSGSGLAVDLTSATGGPEPLSRFLGRPLEGIVGHPLDVLVLEPHPGRPVLYFRGRLHGYQGHSMAEVVFSVRLAALLGAKALIMTNAAGGLHRAQRPGDLAAVRDHINLTGRNPLQGRHPESWGPRFPDMSGAYDGRLRRRLLALAQREGIRLGEGVYAAVAGPSYETPAEVRMLRALGADLVGMSTVPEVIAANHMGLRCACISLVTNLGAGIQSTRLDHEEVIEASNDAAADLQRLLDAALADPDLLAVDE